MSGGEPSHLIREVGSGLSGVTTYEQRDTRLRRLGHPATGKSNCSEVTEQQVTWSRERGDEVRQVASGLWSHKHSEFSSKWHKKTTKAFPE